MRAYLGLGSNLGDRRAHIDEALRRLDAAAGVRVVKRSRLVETKAMGGPDGQPDFLNAACEVETDLSPRELLHAALAVEDAMGRTREVRWGPRNIDVDVLLAEEIVIDDVDLQLPHPRMAGRMFVLEPLAEIAPDARHPVLDRSVRELMEALEERWQR